MLTPPQRRPRNPVARTREGGRLGVAGDLGPDAEEATRHLGWYLVRGCLRGGGGRGGGEEPEGQATIGGGQERGGPASAEGKALVILSVRG